MTIIDPDDVPEDLEEARERKVANEIPADEHDPDVDPEPRDAERVVRIDDGR